MATTAFITKVIDTNISKVASLFSDKTAKAVWQSGQEAVEEFEKIIEEEQIDCEFVRCPNYVIAVNPKQLKELLKDLEYYDKFKLGSAFHEDGDNLGIKEYLSEKAPQVYEDE